MGHIVPVWDDAGRRRHRPRALQPERRGGITPSAPPSSDRTTGITKGRNKMGRSRTDDRAELAAGRTASRDVMAPARSSRLTTDVREQQRRFGGLSLASTFFGWLSATGMATILVALLAAGGAALALTDQHPAATGRQNASTISLAAGLG